MFPNKHCSYATISKGNNLLLNFLAKNGGPASEKNDTQCILID